MGNVCSCPGDGDGVEQGVGPIVVNDAGQQPTEQEHVPPIPPRMRAGNRNEMIFAVPAVPPLPRAGIVAYDAENEIVVIEPAIPAREVRVAYDAEGEVVLIEEAAPAVPTRGGRVAYDAVNETVIIEPASPARVVRRSPVRASPRRRQRDSQEEQEVIPLLFDDHEASLPGTPEFSEILLEDTQNELEFAPDIPQRPSPTRVQEILMSYNDGDVDYDVTIPTTPTYMGPFYRPKVPPPPVPLRTSASSTLRSGNRPPATGDLSLAQYLPRSGRRRQTDTQQDDTDDQEICEDSAGAARDVDKQEILFDGEHVSAFPSLKSIIKYVVFTRPPHIPDKQEIIAFLLCSRYLTGTSSLLDDIYKESVELNVMGNLGHLLNTWTQLLPYQFLDGELMDTLKIVTQDMVRRKPDFRKHVDLTLGNLAKKLDYLKHYEEVMKARAEREDDNQALRGIDPTEPTIYDICPSPKVLAHQLTFIELEMFKQIGPEELVETSREPENTMYLNTTIYTRWFKRLKDFIATEILCHAVNSKRRVQMIEYFIDAVEECWNIGNFNSSKLILESLYMLIPVTRLKKTWKRVNRTKRSNLERFRDNFYNYASYRAFLAAHIASMRSDETEGPKEKCVIPCFDVFEYDMKKVDNDNFITLQNGYLNFEKYSVIAKIMLDYLEFRKTQVIFEKDATIYQYILSTELYDEWRMERSSYACESPVDDYEQRRFEQLRDCGIVYK